MSSPQPMRKILARVCVLLVSLVGSAILLEGACSVRQAWVASGAAPVARESSHCEYDPELGWVHLPNHQVKHLYGAGLHLTTNSQRMRSARDHTEAKPSDVYRVLCLGDSFTMGYGAGDRDTYPAWLERLTPGLEAINMGLGGYGVDQCYLWYLRDGVRFESDVLLLAVISDDFSRMLPKGEVADQPKPMLELVDGEPTPVNLPVPFALDAPDFGARLERTWKRLALRDYAQVRAKARQATDRAPAGVQTPMDELAFVPVAERILERLQELSAERGQRFVVAFLPTEPELLGKRPRLLAEWLEPCLEERGIPLIDLWPAFKALPPPQRQVHFALGHYSSLGNRLAATKLLEGLRALDPSVPR